jgi:hypothetical protein
MTSTQPLRREEYDTNCGIAIIGHWMHNTHLEHLIRLAHIYEDEDDPASKLNLLEMTEIMFILRESAVWYVNYGPHDVHPFLLAEANHLCQRIQAMQAPSDEGHDK